MPTIHHQDLAEAVEAGFCWGVVPVGFRFLLARLLFLLDIETPF